MSMYWGKELASPLKRDISLTFPYTVDPYTYYLRYNLDTTNGQGKASDSSTSSGQFPYHNFIIHHHTDVCHWVISTPLNFIYAFIDIGLPINFINTK
jgi:hypothetical protein